MKSFCRLQGSALVVKNYLNFSDLYPKMLRSTFLGGGVWLELLTVLILAAWPVCIGIDVPYTGTGWLVFQLVF